MEKDGKLMVGGVTHDNGEIVSVTVNGQKADIVSDKSGVVDWTITLEADERKVAAFAKDSAGNVEKTAHILHY